MREEERKKRENEFESKGVSHKVVKKGLKAKGKTSPPRKQAASCLSAGIIISQNFILLHVPELLQMSINVQCWHNCIFKR